MKTLSILAAFALGGGIVTGALEAQQADFDERPAPFQPRVARSEADEDRARAAALYAHGRLLLQREKPEEALRRYQRAWRYSSDAPQLLADIVALAAELDRSNEALRYASLAAARRQGDAALSLRFATLAVEQRDYRRAVLLFEQAARRQREAGELDFTGVLVHLDLGRVHFLLGNAAEAANSLDVVRKALDHPAKFGLSEPLQKLILDKPEQTYALLAEAFFDAGRIEEAAAMVAKLQEVKPDAALHAFQRAKLAAAQKDIASAIHLLDEYFQADSSVADSAPYELLDRCLAEQFKNDHERRKALIERLAALRKKSPQNQPLAEYLADQYRRAERFDDARPIYAELVEREVGAEVYGGWLETMIRHPDDGALLAALGKSALDVPLLDPLDDSLTVLVKDGARVTQLGKSILARPAQPAREAASPGAALAVALVATRAKQFDLADELFERAAAEPRPGRDVVLPAWGLEMFVHQQMPRAARVLRRVLDEKIRPESTRSFYYQLIGALEFAGRTDEALAVAREARDSDQGSALLDSRVGWVYLHAKRDADAERAFRQILQDYDSQYDRPGVREVVREARRMLAQVALRKNDSAAAEEWLEQVLDEFPDDVGAMNDLAYLWADRTKHLQRSLAMSKQAVDDEPDNEAYRDTLGWVLFRQGQFEAALVELQRAAASENPDGVILDHLGDCLQSLKREPEAQSAWERAIKAFREEGDEKRRTATERKLTSKG